MTEAEKYLMSGFLVCKMEKGLSTAIAMTLKTDDQMWRMCDYLASHGDVPGEELLDAARRIAAM